MKRHLATALYVCFLCLSTINPLHAEEAAKCETLKERLSIQEIEVTEPIQFGTMRDNPCCFWETNNVGHIVFSPQPNGEAKVAWMSGKTGAIHITPLDKDLKRKGDDLVLKSGRLLDMLAHDEGGVILTYSGGRMILKFDEKGKVLWSNRSLVGNSSRDLHLGAVAWNGTNYGVYIGVSGGGHEGDAFVHVNGKGQVVRTLWTWGCSHSIDQRAIANSDGKLEVLCLSDIYPRAGFNMNHSQKHVDWVPGSSSGFTQGKLGGLVEVKDDYAVIYTKNVGGGYLSYLNVFNKKTQASRIKGRLTSVAGPETNVKLARYGEKELLVSWKKGNDSIFRLYDIENNRKLAEEKLPVQAQPRGDFKTLPNGDVAWASGWGEAKQLKVMRLRACETKTQETP